MPNYRRNRVKGGCYFFTVNLLVRKQNPLFVKNIELLRDVVKRVRTQYPFHIDGWVILPDHMRNRRNRGQITVNGIYRESLI